MYDFPIKPPNFLEIIYAIPKIRIPARLSGDSYLEGAVAHTTGRGDGRQEGRECGY